MSWLSEVLQRLPLSEEVEGYLLGRGVQEGTIAATRFCTWSPFFLSEPSPCPNFCKMAGDYGEYIDGFLVTPVVSPRGKLIGIEARNIHKKKILDYRLPEANWNPFFLGMQKAMPKLWAGGDVWVAEGLFDIAPLEWFVPEKDAVLATVRAQLSKAHVEFLRRFCKGTVYMVYDRDETGQKGMHGWVDQTGRERWGAVKQLERVGLQCVVYPYYGGKDPGEIWDQGGVEAVKRAFAPRRRN